MECNFFSDYTPFFLTEHTDSTYMDCIDKKYHINSKPLEYSQNIHFYEDCEDDYGTNLSVLTIKRTENNQRKISRIFDNEIKPLTGKEWKGFVKTIGFGEDNDNDIFYVVYEHWGEKTFEKDCTNIEIESLINIAEGLNKFRTENNFGFIISPKYIRIDSNGHVKLLFAKLFDIFAEEKIIEESYLSPQAKEYLNNNSKQHPRHQDDIYSYIKTFKAFINKNYSINYNIITKELISKGLSENRENRFSKYHELIDLLRQLPPICKNKYEIIKICVKTSSEEEYTRIENLRASMNENTRMLIKPELSKNNQIQGMFTTKKYSGAFYVLSDCILIPYSTIKDEPNYEIELNTDSFLAEFDFETTPESESYDPSFCANFFQEKHDTVNNLAKLHKSQKENLEKWQKLPETEKEFIEKNAFKVKYEKIRKTDDGKFIFSLDNQENHISWSRIKKLKNDEKILFIGEQLVGKIHDFHRGNNNTLTIEDPKCQINEIPETGELSEDLRQETSQLKKQVEACQKFIKGDIVNKQLLDIITTPDSEIPCKIHNLNYDEFKNQIYNERLRHDDSQLETVLEAISYKPLYLIQGPPGTGKTTVIVEIIHQLVERQNDVRILLTSQSNLAVDNVLEKLVNTNDIHFIRLASDNAVENDRISDSMKEHCYEEKIRQWVSTVEEKSKEYFNNKYDKKNKDKGLDKAFAYFTSCDNLKEFQNWLNSCPSHVKKMFENAHSLNDIEKIFEGKLGKDFSTLKHIQNDWIAYIGNALVDIDSDGKRKKAMLNNGSQEIDFLTAMLMRTNVVGSTCIHIASSRYSKVNFKFDYVIMDESSKATPAESLVPLSMGNNIIMIGDDKQLPPVITKEDHVKESIKEKMDDNGLDIEKEFGVSLFEQIKKSFENDDNNNERYIKMLDTQYRMPCQIGSLISKFFYDGKLKNPNIDGFDKNKSHNINLTKNTSIVFLSTSSRKDPNPYDNGDKFKRQNQCNTIVIKELLKKINDSCYDNMKQEEPFTIGIIAGYRGQVELLNEQIDKNLYTNFKREDNSSLIEINTVDKFQGAERDIIIYDIVRSSSGFDNIGFLSDYRRINVAFSRAKRLLFIVGDSEYLLKRAQFNKTDDFVEFKLKKITEYLQKEGLIFNNLNDIFK